MVSRIKKTFDFYSVYEKRITFADMKHMLRLFMLVLVATMAASCKRTNNEVQNQQADGDDSNISTFFDTRKNSRNAAKLEMPALRPRSGEQILYRKAYTTAYNKNTKQADWVAWNLKGENTDGRFKRQGISFHEDMDVPAPRATDNDYFTSRYDRGHHCPSGDCKWDKQAQEESFLFTNVSPQNHNLNGGDWNDLEQQCRYWAKKYGELYIVCGPIFDSTQNRKTIGKNKVAVPDRYFKVILCMKDSPKAIGFIYENRSGHKKMSERVVNIDEVERITGLDFYPSLNDNIEKNVESKSVRAIFSDWDLGKADKYNEREYHQRKNHKNR